VKLRAGVNFINFLRTAFTLADSKSIKKTVKLSIFFTLLLYLERWWNWQLMRGVEVDWEVTVCNMCFECGGQCWTFFFHPTSLSLKGFLYRKRTAIAFYYFKIEITSERYYWFPSFHYVSKLGQPQPYPFESLKNWRTKKTITFLRVSKQLLTFYDIRILLDKKYIFCVFLWLNEQNWTFVLEVVFK